MWKKPSVNYNFLLYTGFAILLAIICFSVITAATAFSKKMKDKKNYKNKFSIEFKKPILRLDAYYVNYAKTKGLANKFNRLIFGQNLVPVVNLYSESINKKTNKKILSAKSQYYLNDFLELFAGIDTEKLLHIQYPQITLYANKDISYEFSPDSKLTKKISSLLPNDSEKEPVKNNTEAKLKIYVETFDTRLENGQTQHCIIIGHKIFAIPQNVRDGSLSFLTSLASPLTQIIYLGEYYKDENERKDKRTDFFELLNNKQAFIDYQNYVFPDLKNFSKKIGHNLRWENLSLDQKKPWKNFNDDKQAKKKYYNFLFRQLLAKNTETMPPLITNNQIWKEYCKKYESQNSTPPQWFVDSFLKIIF